MKDLMITTMGFLYMLENYNHINSLSITNNKVEVQLKFTNICVMENLI
jgi:hypothetical protein